MSAAQTLRPGRYRHFKGKEYELLFLATHSETLEPMVVYRALYGERGLWVRPAAMWDGPSAASHTSGTDNANGNRCAGPCWKEPRPRFWD